MLGAIAAVLLARRLSGQLKARSQANERSGDPHGARKDISIGELVAQAIGFTPAQLAQQYRLNSTIKGIEAAIMEERSRLLGRYYNARQNRDREGLQDALADIRAFNRKPINRGVRIDSDTIERSIAARRRTSGKMQGGVMISNPELARDVYRIVGQ